MRIVLIVVAGVALSGCALVPNTITPEFDHVSHLTQHAPFTNDPTNYGSEIANIVVGYELPYNVKVDLVEGIDLDKHWVAPPNQGYGEVLGPREQFSLRIGYTFRIKN